jgi:hypothetical protein
MSLGGIGDELPRQTNVILHARTAGGQLGIGTQQAPECTVRRRLAPSSFADCMLYSYTSHGKEECRARRWRFQALRQYQ